MAVERARRVDDRRRRNFEGDALDDLAQRQLGAAVLIVEQAELHRRPAHESQRRGILPVPLAHALDGIGCSGRAVPPRRRSSGRRFCREYVHDRHVSWTSQELPAGEGGVVEVRREDRVEHPAPQSQRCVARS
jgi:hypothetical protein